MCVMERLPLLYTAGEWWKKNVMEIEGNANKTGGEPALSDAYTINGHPGHFYPCSKQGIHLTPSVQFSIKVELHILITEHLEFV